MPHHLLGPSLLFALATLAGCSDDKPTVEMVNQPPGAPVASIAPTSPRTEDDLLAVIQQDSDDADGDTVTYGYRWFVDGEPRDDLTAETVPASETTKGQVWTLLVTPNDGEEDGETATVETTVLNTAPVATVTLSPETPTTEDELLATAAATDADGDTVTFSYAWALDAAPQADVTDRISADRTEHGDVWAVTVTPMDDEEAGTPVTAEVEIANSAPVMLSVAIVPEAPYVTDDLVAVVEASDADGDPIGYSYTWYVDGTEVQSGASDTLAGGGFAKHQRISVEVVPNDGFVDGAAFVSADAVAVNSQPTATGASIDPGTAYEASTLTCVPAGFADADGDAEGWTYSWSVNGTEVATTSTLDGASFSKGDTVACTATPWDGEESGAAVTSATLTVSNTAPVLASVDLSTYAPTENDTIAVTLGTGSDDDGDSVSYGYDWYVNGSVVSTSSTLDAGSFDKGDSIYVVVTPWDGSDWGVPVTSAVATGANTPPAVSSVTLSPSDVYTDDTITATVAATDLDGDMLSYTYDWYVDGVPRGSATSATLSGATYFDKDQEVYVVVTPNDGEADGTAGTSSTVTVLNSAPTPPVVEITPEDAEAGDDLTCTVTTASTDADGDAITYTFAWDVDGVEYTGASDAAMESAVDGGDVEGEATWTCAVEGSDGTAVAEASASVAVVESCVPALDLAGTGYATLPQYSGFGTLRSYSVWIYPREGNGSIFNDGYSGTYCASHGLNISSSMQVGIGVNGGTSGSRCSPSDSAWGPTIVTDLWQHVAVVVDGTTVSFYLNGALSSTDTISAIDPYTPIRDLWVGVEANRPLSEIFDAAISDLAMWNRALSASEVSSVYLDGPGAETSGLVSWWAMDEGSGVGTDTGSADSTLEDGSGVVGSGTVVGASWTYRCPDGTTVP